MLDGPRSFAHGHDSPRGLNHAVGPMKGWTVKQVQTSSKAARTPRSPLWPVNLPDRIVRHCPANHERETIAFSKREQAVPLREAVLQVWRNWIQGRSERVSHRSPRPAMLRALVSRRLTARELLGRRLFPSRVRLDDELEEIDRERIPTPQVERPRSHDLEHAA